MSRGRPSDEGAGPTPGGIPVDRALVAAVLDRLVPADDHPGAVAAGALDELDRHAGGDHAHLWEGWLASGFVALDTEARARHGRPFTDLSAEQQDEVLAAAEAGATRADWPVPAERFFAAMERLAAECF